MIPARLFTCSKLVYVKKCEIVGEGHGRIAKHSRATELATILEIKGALKINLPLKARQEQSGECFDGAQKKGSRREEGDPMKSCD